MTKKLKQWKDSKDRYELRLHGLESGVLYYDTLFGFYFQLQIGNGITEVDIKADILQDAKAEAEKRLAEILRKQIETYEKCIKGYEEKLTILGERNNCNG